MDNNLGLPSDDSDDDDYNPNGPEDVKIEGDESSSDDSEYASASEKLEDTHEDPYLGLPSEDSDDGDYDPIAPDVDSKSMKEVQAPISHLILRILLLQLRITQPLDRMEESYLANKRVKLVRSYLWLMNCHLY